MVNAAPQHDTDNQQSQQNLEPPGPDRSKSGKPLLLAIQTLYLALICIPVFVYSVIESFFVKPKSLKGQVVLITGSGRGLGRGFAMKFAQLGCKVACVDINESINEQTVLEINEQYGSGKAIAYNCNVGSSEQIANLRKRVLEDLGPVDVLLHNAGIIVTTPSITTVEDKHLYDIVNVNLNSHFLMTREFLPDMIKRNQGHVVAVSSVAGFMSHAKGSLYAATKHGVIGLMESVHRELEEIPNNQVKTTVICPYFVNTSAAYQKIWDLRIPEMSINQVVNEAVTGIRTNKRIFSCPAYMYYVLIFARLLPDRVHRKIMDVYYVKIE